MPISVSNPGTIDGPKIGRTPEYSRSDQKTRVALPSYKTWLNSGVYDRAQRRLGTIQPPLPKGGPNGPK